ncbi:hypothetical protein AMAG_16864 [Allomyces macrogynus ATCC 38327]|uniref:DUF4200 domain-containing protein n=1 Tax=Allomyces macrogynus (strain ATCC 38327) TaxID=578462 RepID=A0A0L0TCX8_ALLM3|nr:hypothetical protein AMAG_16864 [Allomyces macrogynus ATCC 38327]|eukprot:KNE72379.1 hypothetical protein AMAG_16864 [Allomyces macrogynus ATCC 38327]
MSQHLHLPGGGGRNGSTAPLLGTTSSSNPTSSSSSRAHLAVPNPPGPAVSAPDTSTTPPRRRASRISSQGRNADQDSTRGGPGASEDLLADMDASGVFLTQHGGALLESSVTSFLGPGTASRTGVPATDLQSTLLIRRRKELKHVQSLLEKKRAEFSKRMDECREKHEELKAKQKQLRDRVQKFEKFLRENDAKRQRALAKALSERKSREQKEQELFSLQDQLRQEQAKSERVKHMISMHRPHEQYLQWVISSLPSDYLDVQEPHINDVLTRYHTLSETNHDLQETLQLRLDEIEAETNRLNDLIKQKNDRILVYNSQLGALQKRLDKAKAESARVENMVAESVLSGKARMRNLSETKLAINNIYSRLGTRQGQTVLSEASSQFAEKLAAIQDRVLDLAQIAAKAEQFMREDKDRQRTRFAQQGPGVRIVEYSDALGAGGRVSRATTPASAPADGVGGFARGASRKQSVAASVAGGG